MDHTSIKYILDILQSNPCHSNNTNSDRSLLRQDCMNNNLKGWKSQSVYRNVQQSLIYIAKEIIEGAQNSKAQGINYIRNNYNKIVGLPKQEIIDMGIEILTYHYKLLERNQSTNNSLTSIAQIGDMFQKIDHINLQQMKEFYNQQFFQLTPKRRINIKNRSKLNLNNFTKEINKLPKDDQISLYVRYANILVPNTGDSTNLDKAKELYTQNLLQITNR